jgi:hypothetical protein
MIFGLIVGIAIGFFFKPQIEAAAIKAIRAIKEMCAKGDQNKDHF